MEKTKELFDIWNREKKFLEFYKNKLKIVKKWEIWMTKVWINIWSEISKDWEFSRPVLVLKSHLWWDLVWVIPFTSKYSNRYSKFLLEFEDFEKYWLSQKSYLILNQFKIISLRRLDRILNNTIKKWINYPLVDEKIISNITNELKSRIL